jgi:hypothetical protein
MRHRAAPVRSNVCRLVCRAQAFVSTERTMRSSRSWRDHGTTVGEAIAIAICRLRQQRIAETRAPTLG